MVVFSPLAYPGYNWMSMAISELSAAGAPSKELAGQLNALFGPCALGSVMAFSMFSPLLAVIISKSDMKKIGWKPNIKKNIRWIMCAWFIPLVLGVMGAALYFLLFPSAWDTSFLYIRSTLGTDGISQLENSGISVPLYAGIPTLFLNPAYADKLLVEPLMIGVISGLPLMLTAFILSQREKNTIMKER